MSFLSQSFEWFMETTKWTSICFVSVCCSQGVDHHLASFVQIWCLFWHNSKDTEHLSAFYVQIFWMIFIETTKWTSICFVSVCCSQGVDHHLASFVQIWCLFWHNSEDAIRTSTCLFFLNLLNDRWKPQSAIHTFVSVCRFGVSFGIIMTQLEHPYSPGSRGFLCTSLF